MRVFLLLAITYLYLSIFVSRTFAQVDLAKEYPFGRITSLSEAIGYLIMPAFSIAGIAVLVYFLWGSFKLLASGGDKNAVAEGRGMIVHAIIGFMLLILTFIIFQFLPEFLGFNFRIIQVPTR